MQLSVTETRDKATREAQGCRGPRSVLTAYPLATRLERQSPQISAFGVPFHLYALVPVIYPHCRHLDDVLFILTYMWACGWFRKLSSIRPASAAISSARPIRGPESPGSLTSGTITLIHVSPRIRRHIRS
jgi:hypothetical protein